MPSVITEPEDIADSASAGRSGGHVASADVPRSTKGAAMKTARALSWRGRDRTFVLASLVDHPGRATGRAEISADPPRAGARGWGTGPGQERVRRGSDTPDVLAETGPPRDMIAQQFTSRDTGNAEMRGDQRALSPLARVRRRDHRYSHYSSLPVIIAPADPGRRPRTVRGRSVPRSPAGVLVRQGET